MSPTSYQTAPSRANIIILLFAKYKKSTPIILHYGNIKYVLVLYAQKAKYMKIHSVNLTNQTKSPDKINKTEKTSDVIQKTSVNTCPLGTLQAYNNISFGAENPSFYVVDNKNKNVSMVTSRITLNSGKTYKLNLDSELIDIYLSDEKGSINKEKLDGFVSIYKTVLQSIVDEDSRQREFLTSIVSGKEKSPKGQKILYLNPNDEARESILQTLLDPEADFLTTFFNGIGNDTLRKDYAKDILSECKQTDDMMQGQALSRTMQLIDIFGFEQSNLGQKIKFVEQLAELETNYSGDNIVDDFIQEVKNENGEIDFKFANNLLRLIKNTPVYLPERLVSHRSAILKDFTALEPEKSDKIAQSIIKLSSIYDVDDENTNFEEFFNYAFNPVTDKFDAEAFGLLMQAVGSVKIKFEDFEINNDIDLARLAQSEIDTVQSYFELVKDPKTGGIIPNSISPRKYILQN